MMKPETPKSLLEVWEWKDAAWKSVEHLDLDSAIRKRLSDSAETLKRWGLAFSETTTVNKGK